MANFITGIVSLSISAVVLANVYISIIKGTTTCVAGASGAICNGTAGYGTNMTGVAGYGFTSAELALWSLLALLGIVGMLYGVLSIFGIL